VRVVPGQRTLSRLTVVHRSRKVEESIRKTR
jgi:hypothetical protein